MRRDSVALVAQAQRERRQRKLHQARAKIPDVPDMFSNLGPICQPRPFLYATRTPLTFGVAITDRRDVIDMSDLMREDMERCLQEEENKRKQAQEEEEIRKAMEDEEARQRHLHLRELEQERENQEARARQRHEDDARARQAEEELRAMQAQEEELRARHAEEEVRARQAEEEAQRRAVEGQSSRAPHPPFKSRYKQRAHKNVDQETDERRKKFKNDRPAWERRAPPPPPPKVTRKYKFKPGTVALREIRKYQKTTELLIPKASFARVVREVMEECSDSVTRIQSNAVLALQEATEEVISSVFQDSVLCHVHRQRVTLKPKDLALALRIRDRDYLRKS